jgi:uncharacterized protein (TIGR03437 family)
LSDGDQYSVVGIFNTANSSGSSFSLTYDFVITYLGNGSAAASQTDLINVDAYSAFQSGLPSGGFGQALSGAFSSNIAAGSLAQMCAFGVCVGPIGPPGIFSLTGGAYSLNATNGAFAFDNTFSAQFGSGSPVGSYIVFASPLIAAPSIQSGGTVPVYSASTTVQPGSWISIYGNNLAVSTFNWTGNFPTSLAATSVTIDSKPAYLWFVSPTQINAQVPDDSTTGPVNVVVTTPFGSATGSVTLGPYAPSFSLFNSKYVAAIVPTPGSSGNSGAGYDVIGPTGAFTFASRPAKVGETVAIYGVGFGPTNPNVPAGQVISSVAPSVTNPVVNIGGVAANVTFAGIVEAGLFQINIVVPNVPSGDQAITASIGGATTTGNVFLTIQ